MSWLLGSYAEQRTSCVLAYLLLGLSLGILDFTIMLTGLSLGIGLIVTLLGMPVLILTLLALESTGRVGAHHQGGRAFYALVRK